MKHRRKWVTILLAAMMVMTCFPSCSGNQNVIRVGSKDFTESFLMAELYSLALEDHGFTVDRRFNLGGSPVAQAALEKGDIDVYPEYTGTALLQILNLPIDTDPQKVYETVKEEYKTRFGLTWLNYTQASNSQGLAMTKEASEKYGIKTISALQKNASEIRFASTTAFAEIADGLPLLEEHYGEFNFKETRVFDVSLKYQVLLNGEMDLTVAFLTDGQLADDRFVVLEDDKHVWPPYNIAPIVRDETLEQYPEIEEILNNVSQALDNETMRFLNSQVDIEQKDYEAVAREFYESHIKE